MITIGKGERREDQRPFEKRPTPMAVVPKDHWQGLLSAARAVCDNWETNRLAAAVNDLSGTLATIAVDNAVADFKARRE